MKTILTMLVIVLGLSGCATNLPETPRVIYKFIAVPMDLTEKVQLVVPPEPEAYSRLSCDVKEKVLMDLIQERTTEIGIANTRLYGIRNWSSKQSLIYDKATD